jgi:hypothetical protein
MRLVTNMSDSSLHAIRYGTDDIQLYIFSFIHVICDRCNNCITSIAYTYA